jgi:hypothetical protein
MDHCGVSFGSSPKYYIHDGNHSHSLQQYTKLDAHGFSYVQAILKAFATLPYSPSISAWPIACIAADYLMIARWISALKDASTSMSLIDVCAKGCVKSRVHNCVNEA